MAPTLRPLAAWKLIPRKPQRQPCWIRCLSTSSYRQPLPPPPRLPPGVKYEAIITRKLHSSSIHFLVFELTTSQPPRKSKHTPHPPQPAPNAPSLSQPSPPSNSPSSILDPPERGSSPRRTPMPLDWGISCLCDSSLVIHSRECA